MLIDLIKATLSPSQCPIHNLGLCPAPVHQHLAAKRLISDLFSFVTNGKTKSMYQLDFLSIFRLYSWHTPTSTNTNLQYILLVRHGESEGNCDKSVNRFIANHKVVLTETGLK